MSAKMQVNLPHAAIVGVTGVAASLSAHALGVQPTVASIVVPMIAGFSLGAMGVRVAREYEPDAYALIEGDNPQYELEES